MTGRSTTTLCDSLGPTCRGTRRADPAIARRLARLVGVEPGGRFLDLACGTGNCTCALARLGGHWSGLDASRVMLAQASDRSGAVEWRCGTADELPWPDNFFDGVICTLSIHHFPELGSPFREVGRVLKGNSFVIFTAFPAQMRQYWLCHCFPDMMRRSIESMLARSSVLAALESAGFALDAVLPFEVTLRLEDLFLYSGKQRPELYFDPIVRANISSFAVGCSPQELDVGLVKLRRDLDDGQFQRVARRYSSPGGDYAYVVARKQRGGRTLELAHHEH